jgi:hypothetical protein
METQGLIPDHQFGFRGRSITIEQIHNCTIVKRINNKMEVGRYCAAASMSRKLSARRSTKNYFIKLKTAFHFISIIRSYLLYGTFRIKYGEVVT